MSVKNAAGVGRSSGASGVGVRPAGYQFPVGLTGGNTGTTTSETIYTTPSPGTYAFPATATGTTAELLIVAGGGASGQTLGGGGGGGGVVFHSAYPYSPATAVSVSVGSGGVFTPGGSPTRGSDTTFGVYTAKGGGNGREGPANSNAPTVPGGSSGGGNYYDGPTGTLTGGNSQPSQSNPGTTQYGNQGAGGSGYNPANSSGNYNLGGGGGGGASSNATANPLAAPDAPYKSTSGNAGSGVALSTSGTTLYYGGGGGGFYQHRAGTGNGGNPIQRTTGLANTTYGQGGSAPGTTESSGTPGAVIVKYFTNNFNIN